MWIEPQFCGRYYGWYGTNISVQGSSMRQRLAPDMPLPPLTAAHISSQSDGPSIEHQYHYGGMRPQGAVMGDRGWHGLRALPACL
ncbi:hypothetical protein VTO73DRAFT_7492 [Trametes versicolor]